MNYELLKFFEAEGYGTEGVNLFLEFQPDMPDNCITLESASAPNLLESDSLNVDNYGVHIVVRNSNCITAKNLIYSIHQKIVGFGGQKLIPSGHEVSYITTETNPTFLNKDEKNRNEYSATYNIRTMTAGVNRL
jgi:hypothetical protein